MDPEYRRLVSEVEDEHWWYVGRRRIIARILADLELSTDTRILDLGCGAGGNLATLAGFGELSALEMDPYLRRIARTRGVCEVVEGSLPANVPFEGESFELVTVLDVVEHVEDDAAALAEIRRLLVHGGRVVVTVPAYPSLWSRHDEINRHYRRYTRGMLQERLRRAGFQVERCSGFNAWLFPVGAIARVASRLLAVGGESDMRLPPAMRNRLLLRVFASESSIVSSFSLPFGLSILAVARRLR